MHVVVVGASLAGFGVAAALRERGHTGQITLLGEEPHPPYDRPPLSKQVLTGGVPALELAPAGWYADQKVDLRVGVRAVGLDAAQRTVRTDFGPVPYDRLVIATGCRARSLPTALSCPGVLALRTRDDATLLRRELRPGRRLLVIGAGFIGLEVAAAARTAGLEVTVVELAPTPLERALGAEVGSWFADLHRRQGVRLCCGTAVHALCRERDAHVALTDTGSTGYDVVVAGVGASACVEWLLDSGVELDDGVVCDEAGRTSVPDVWAAGDVARWHSPAAGAARRVEHWSNAVEQAQIVAAGLLGQEPQALGVPSFWSDQYIAKARFVGHPGLFDRVRVEERSEDTLVARYEWHGQLTAALCVNRPRELARLRREIGTVVREPALL